jgi:hypothetical protein
VATSVSASLNSRSENVLILPVIVAELELGKVWKSLGVNRRSMIQKTLASRVGFRMTSASIGASISIRDET